MSVISIPIEKFLSKKEHWWSYHTIDETGDYCDFLDRIQDRINSLQVPDKEEATLVKVLAIICPNAFVNAMNSIWALDTPPKTGPHNQDLLARFNELREETKESGRHCIRRRISKAAWTIANGQIGSNQEGP